MQVFDPATFDTELEQWLNPIPPTSLAAQGILPPPGQVLSRPGYANHDVRIQRDSYLAVSGTVSVTLDAVRLSICAPPFLFLSARPPVVSIWLPISDWGNVSRWAVIEALQHAARSLLRPYDPSETLSGQMFANIFVSSQVQRLRHMMDAMPIAAWDLQATPIHSQHPLSLRWSSAWNPAYLGPLGQVFHHRNLGTSQGVFTFEIQHPASFAFQYTLDANDEYLNPHQLRDVVKNMIYMN